MRPPFYLLSHSAYIISKQQVENKSHSVNDICAHNFWNKIFSHASIILLFCVFSCHKPCRFPSDHFSFIYAIIWLALKVGSHFTPFWGHRAPTHIFTGHPAWVLRFFMLRAVKRNFCEQAYRTHNRPYPTFFALESVMV